MKTVSHIIIWVSLILLPVNGMSQSKRTLTKKPVAAATAKRVTTISTKKKSTTAKTLTSPTVIRKSVDTLTATSTDNLKAISTPVLTRKDSMELQSSDSITRKMKKKMKTHRDWSTWRPDVKRALWLSIVLPGAGQIYNHKYWKLPIIYGGFVGCIYALSWNGQMYHDYSQAYSDIMDSDPNTNSYNQFLHLGVTINSSNEALYQNIFRLRKDRYRRWRDMSVFAMVAVYAISIIDAYVDASLSDYDISKDLSLHFEPTMIGSNIYTNPLKGSALGVQCSLNF